MSNLPANDSILFEGLLFVQVLYIFINVMFFSYKESYRPEPVKMVEMPCFSKAKILRKNVPGHIALV